MHLLIEPRPFDHKTGDRLYQRIRAHLFELAVAVAWAMVGTAYLLDPEAVASKSPLGHAIGNWPTVWSLLEIIGGVMTAGAILRRNTRFRVAGLTLLATGIGMQAVAVTVYGNDLRILVYYTYAGACAARALYCGKVASKWSD